MAISKRSFDELVPKETLTDDIKYSFLCRGRPGEEEYNYDMRTPGLFKIEWQGDKMISLCSKTYVAVNSELDDAAKDKMKLSCKGLSKRTNKLLYDHYDQVLKTGESYTGVNCGFRSLPGGQLKQYTQFRDGLCNFYCKRRVRADGISTDPIDIE